VEYVEKAGNDHKVLVNGVLKNVTMSDIFKCGERMNEPCRETESLKLKFIPFNLKNTINKWEQVLSG